MTRARNMLRVDKNEKKLLRLKKSALAKDGNTSARVPSVGPA
jgi:hypothetical protein